MPHSTLQARAKSARLRAGFQSEAAAAAAIGCSRPLVIAWENGGAKSIGGKYLLQAARAYKVRPEWLASGTGQDGYPWGEGSAPESQSQLAKLNPEMIAETHWVLRRHDARRGRVFNIEAEPERFLQACSIWLDLPAERTEQDMMEFALKVAELTPQGALAGHERVEDVPVAGNTGGAKRRQGGSASKA